MIQIDYETAVNDVSEIVKGREDYVYVNPNGETAKPVDTIKCYYFDPKTKKPSCIVGHVLARHGVGYEDVKDSNWSYLLNAVAEAEVFIEPPAMSFLEEVQGSQDVGVPWGEAFQKGLRFEHGGF